MTAIIEKAILGAIPTAFIRAQKLVLEFEKEIAEAVAEAEAVAHATGRLNMALAIENEQERCAKVADRWARDGAPNGAEIAAAIRKVKP